jgi:hypothetical protein
VEVDSYISNARKTVDNTSYIKTIDLSTCDFDALMSFQQLQLWAFAVSFIAVPFRALKVIISCNYFDKLFKILCAFYRATWSIISLMTIILIFHFCLALAMYSLFRENIAYFRDYTTSITSVISWKPKISDLEDLDISYMEIFWILAYIVIEGYKTFFMLCILSFLVSGLDKASTFEFPDALGKKELDTLADIDEMKRSIEKFTSEA